MREEVIEGRAVGKNREFRVPGGIYDVIVSKASGMSLWSSGAWVSTVKIAYISVSKNRAKITAQD